MTYRMLNSEGERCIINFDAKTINIIRLTFLVDDLGRSFPKDKFSIKDGKIIVDCLKSDLRLIDAMIKKELG